MDNDYTPITGRWWLDCEYGVWPCEVLGTNVFGSVRVRQTHESGPRYGEEIVVSASRVYDSGFNRVGDAVKRVAEARA